MVNYPSSSRTSGPGYGQTMLSLGDGLGGWLASKAKSPRQTHLEQLWKNWSMVMGPELAGQALPLGHREGLLLIGGEDHFVLQELAYSVPEILLRVNAFMAEEYFKKVELHLMFGKTPLNRTQATVVPPAPPPPRPPRLGSLLNSLDLSSPVGQCYEAYVRYFKAAGKPAPPTAGE